MTSTGLMVRWSCARCRGLTRCPECVAAAAAAQARAVQVRAAAAARSAAAVAVAAAGDAHTHACSAAAFVRVWLDAYAVEQNSTIAWLETLVGAEDSAMHAKIDVEKEVLDTQHKSYIDARTKMGGRDAKLRKIQRCVKHFIRRMDREEMRKLDLSWPDAAAPRFPDLSRDGEAGDVQYASAAPPGAKLACRYGLKTAASQAQTAANWEGHLRTDARLRSRRARASPAARVGAYEKE